MKHPHNTHQASKVSRVSAGCAERPVLRELAGTPDTRETRVTQDYRDDQGTWDHR